MRKQKGMKEYAVAHAPFAEMNARELCALYDAYSLASQGYLAVMNQPRIGVGQAESILENEREAIHDKMEAIVAILAAMSWVGEYDKGPLTRVLVDWSLYMGGPLIDTVAVLTAAAALPEVRT